jgi:hypothetical protein
LRDELLRDALKGDGAAANTPPAQSEGVSASGPGFLPKGHRTLLKLGLLAGEAQKLVGELHIWSYGNALVTFAPAASWDNPPGPQSLAPGVTRHFDGKLEQLNVIASEFKALTKELVETLRRPVEVYPRGVGASWSGFPGKDLRAQVEDYERELVLSALQACDMNQVLAAKILRVLPTTLNEKMKRLGLRRPRPRRGGQQQGAILER